MWKQRLTYFAGIFVIFSILGISFIVINKHSKKGRINPVLQVQHSAPAAHEDNLVIVGTQTAGLYLSYNNGISFRKAETPLLKDSRGNDAAVKSVHVIQKGEFVVITHEAGLIYTSDGGKTFSSMNNGLPKKRIVVNGTMADNIYRNITSFTIDTENKNNMFLTTKYGIYKTKDRGRTWSHYSRPPKYFNNLVSVAFTSKNGFRLYLGTAYNGMFVQEDENGKWHRFNEGLKMTGGIVEEIGSLVIDPRDYLSVYCGNSFGNRLYKLNKKRVVLKKNPEGKIIGYSVRGSSWKSLRIPFKKMQGSVEQLNDFASLHIDYTQNQRFFNVVTSLGVIQKQSGNSDWNKVNIRSILSSFEAANDINALVILKNGEPDRVYNNLDVLFERKQYAKKSRYFHLAANRKGYYMQTHVAAQESRLQNLIDSLKENGYNMVTIDLKDDFGHVNFTSNLDIVKKVGADKGMKINLKKFLKIMKENGIYVVARLVVFKDPVLFQYLNGKYTVYDSVEQKPWIGYLMASGGRKLRIKERWLDPFSEFVWKYNAAIAKELESYGVDEIQFDYIRFPTDGDNLDNAEYRFRRPEQERKDAIESFLHLARNSINIPISVDIYGANGWYRMGDKLGQDIEMISHYADAIAPMFYPSHFHPAFHNFSPLEERPYRIYYYGTRRSMIMTGYKVVIRSWLQAFKLNSNPYDRNYYNRDYIAYQILGMEDAGDYNGLTWWNSATRYTIVKKGNQRARVLKNRTGIRRREPVAIRDND